MLNTLARMLGLSPTDAEASMHSERAARAVLTRRNLFAAGAAMATGAAFSFPTARVFTYADWLEAVKIVEEIAKIQMHYYARLRVKAPVETFAVFDLLHARTQDKAAPL